MPINNKHSPGGGVSVTTTAADTAPPITKAIPSTTPLNSLHLSQGAKMVPFAGYSMPLLYPPQTHISEHNWTREHASIFDVSHMVQHIFSGPGALAFLESLTPTDLSAQGPFKSTLSVLLAHPTGGIIDDTIITMQASQERFYVVTNAGCREKDLLYFREALRKWKESPTFKEKGEVVHEVLEDWGLIALQGPEAKDVLAEYLAHALPPQVEFNLDEVKFGTSFEASVPASEKVGERVTVHIARGGYTGEDGFEISIPPGPTTTESQIPHPKSSLPAAASSTVPVLNPTTYITNMLLRIGGKERIMMAGLAARDSLRLEAGMCLYGHDLNEDITPVEASLGWIVHKRRRADGLFPGGSVIQAQLAKDGTPPEKKRIGLDLGSGGAPAREGMNIVKLGEKGETEVVGHVTSGGPAISLGMKNIAMGYVRREYGQVGTVLGVDVRGNVREAKVVRMPFVPTKYWKGIKGKGYYRNGLATCERLVRIRPGPM
ncbi:glycine cleavage system T protein [Tirmania nivea]|nr:glycine cleavage system T protein [Tirmania nivea]